MMILLGDIGGTKTRLSLVADDQWIREEDYPSQNYPSLEAIIANFLQPEEGVDMAVFALAGPIQEDVCNPTNLPWRIEKAALMEALKCKDVQLINDLVANAYGIDMLKEEDFKVLQIGQKDFRGNRAIISAGTGLGEAGIYRSDDHYYPFATEGGHADYAPRSPLEYELYLYLEKHYDHVSYERILSGRGLTDIYRFLVQKNPSLSGSISPINEKNAKEISLLASNREDMVAAKAMDLFVSVYGAEAGNVALKFLSLGGLFIGGGIAPQIMQWLEKGSFMRSFLDKGRFSSLLEKVPVTVILNDRAAILGAYAYLQDKS